MFIIKDFKMKKFIYLIGIILLFVSCSCVKTSSFDVDINVSYIYQNNPDTTYTINYKDKFNFNSSVMGIDPKYSVDPGWINDLILYNNSRFYSKKDGVWHNFTFYRDGILLIKSPDNKLKVVSILTSCNKTNNYERFN